MTVANEGGATDPGSWADLVRSFGPTAAVLVCFVLLVLVFLAVVGALIVWWRGSERWGIIGFGEEYQKTRMAHERIASATERTEKVNERIEKFLESLPQVLRDALRDVLSTPPSAPQVPPAAQQPPAPEKPVESRGSRPSITHKK